MVCSVVGISARAPAQEGLAEPATAPAPGPSDAGEGAENPAVAAVPSIESGRRLYVQTGCAGCHGFSGQGGFGPMTGPRLAARPDDLPIEAFLYLIRNPAMAMPPYSEKVLSDDQARDIYAYLLTAFKPGKIEDIPMLNRPR
ncbi:c-type cytochrome [Blastomonas fulva]|uniref:c-type cytochrome n=1 Tax=Blastomonas fulva TaxID=1550728 RepID=UPI003F71F2A4